MITHIVMWNVKVERGGKSRTERSAAIKARLEELPAIIPEIRDYRIGINVNPSDRSMDVALISTFDSLDDLAAYSAHPAHQAALPFIRQRTVEVRVVDFAS